MVMKTCPVALVSVLVNILYVLTCFSLEWFKEQFGKHFRRDEEGKTDYQCSCFCYTTFIVIFSGLLFGSVILTMVTLVKVCNYECLDEDGKEGPNNILMVCQACFLGYR
eukprot:UN03673